MSETNFLTLPLGMLFFLELMGNNCVILTTLSDIQDRLQEHILLNKWYYIYLSQTLQDLSS